MQQHPRPDQVIAVVVSYHPQQDLLARLIGAIRGQVRAVVVVDNTPQGTGAEIARAHGAHAIALQRNLGLAAGFNRGCEWARGEGAAFVLLFDQDSNPAPDMVAQLCAAWRAASPGRRIAAVGPSYHDPRGMHPPSFLRVAFPRNHPVEDSEGQPWVRTDILISSGCLVSIAALAELGGMDESLFIDNVDIEWGFRARARGWALIGAPQARLDHQIGDAHIPVPRWLPLGRSTIIRHGSTRLYYIMRNRVLLYWMPHVPLAWKAQDLLRIPAKVVLALAVAEDRMSALKRLGRGISHGLTGRRGPMP